MIVSPVWRYAGLKSWLRALLWVTRAESRGKLAGTLIMAGKIMGNSLMTCYGREKQSRIGGERVPLILSRLLNPTN